MSSKNSKGSSTGPANTSSEQLKSEEGKTTSIGPFPRNSAFTMPIYPPLPETLPTKAQHGVLGQLDGTWVNAPDVYGAHTTILPAPGSTSEQMFGTYHFLSQEYTESLTFNKNPNPVRNRLGSNEQFNGALGYQTTIEDRTNAVIHFEEGQYLWLGIWTHQSAAPYSEPPMLFSRQATQEDVDNNFTFPVLAEGAQGPQFIPPYSISRQGSIPHGNAIQLMGKQDTDPTTGGPAFDIPGAPVIASLWDDDSLAFNNTMGYTGEKLRKNTSNKRIKPDFASFPIYQEPEPKGGFPEGTLDPNSGEAYVQRIFNASQSVKQSDGPDEELPMFPYCVQPNLKLVDANEGLDIQSYDYFELSTKHQDGIQGGALNNVGSQRYAKVVEMQLRMWIEKVRDPSTGKLVDQLQYEQRVFFEFQFGVNGEVTRWPHFQVNTLRRKEDLESANV